MVRSRLWLTLREDACTNVRGNFTDDPEIEGMHSDSVESELLVFVRHA